MDDLISRQAAIDVIDAVFPVDPMKSEYAQGIACGAALAKTYVEQLPSAQPEPHYCRECKWSRCHINVDKYGNTETYWHCLNWDGGTDEEGYCYEWERRIDERA